ncbi:2,3,4,5-tetrahydropyridine-2,6-dicarboxylate N-succinyltransferase [Candidatus Odyssella acanthamoebae]|uniref:2,3,4,5-tetrahydropyridine-2,6-dicarboxylate N-succinyltransferase n=1 Tax=Candidatus Odyssella acanthamoebae TaxID=91604 RepID=A0A077AYR8_9PROT|nr:2,3,4,5-tetrahydropyridine-2,6-dicarboxylate N-succinyltransferase [Candidatus Paracaedibacter acanthamoebae]AIK97149.1 2,3,4,5-tetrahydropyridine-2,6-carboxylate N-succinyltransferase [Candidatus Paracaedibacter acanthamoebae]
MTDQTIINNAWENRQQLKIKNTAVTEAVHETLSQLDTGKLRVAEKIEDKWVVHQWIKKAILLSFRLRDNQIMPGMGDVPWYDKVPLKTSAWTDSDFAAAGFRCVPGSIVRQSAFIEKDVVLMPSFINVGARVGKGTMVDTWVTIGSCAQIGSNCHISGGVGIGGVLEPLQANPVIIEDNCFIGARSEIAEGVIVEEGAVISMGVFLGASTKIVDRQTGQVIYGHVPAYSVVVPGTLPGATPQAPALACAVIVKKVDAKTRSKVGINELLRP